MFVCIHVCVDSHCVVLLTMVVMEDIIAKDFEFTKSFSSLVLVEASISQPSLKKTTS